MRQRIRKLFIFAVALLAGTLVLPSVATHASLLRAQSLPETAEAVGKARVSTRVLFVTAHPDDEWSSLLTYLSRGLDADVALLTVTRGQGGQNAIGPEQDGELGVIRTEELLAAGSHYGVHQFFTRAVDTGFSKSPEQTMKIWGQVPLEDMVRVIRTYRPQVVINGWGGVHSGHGQHQATGLLTPEAVADAADPKFFPEQISEGLKPWKVTLELRMARGGSQGAVELPVSDVSSLWGKSYVQMGMEGHAQHRSQGTPAFSNNPFFRRPIYLVKEDANGPAGSFDPKLLAAPLTALADRFPALAGDLRPPLEAAEKDLGAAEKSVLALDRAAAAKSLAAAGREIASLREKIDRENGEDGAEAAWELDRVREKIDAALEDDVALPVELQAERHEIVAGESFAVDVIFPGDPAVPVKWTLNAASFQLPGGWTASPEKSNESDSHRFRIDVPANARLPQFPGDAILPFPPPLVQLALNAVVNDYTFRIERPVTSMQATTTGVTIYPLELVPAVTLTVDPRQVIVPEQRDGKPIQLLARVRYHGTAKAKVSVGLDAPQGWTAEEIAPLEFPAAGDQLIRFVVTPPAKPAPGAYELHPYARLGDALFRTSLEPIPTLPSHDWAEPDDATVHVLALDVPQGLRIGYIAADNDPLPDVIRQLGVRVDLLDEVALAFGDLNRYDAIVVGIRAYELRHDVPRSNRRLLEYVRQGGTLVVQYERDFAWDVILPAPFPATMADQALRVTDAHSPVRFLAPDNPLLNTPNKITQADFQGWVQERGLYFWSNFGPPYQAVLGLTDPGEAETNGGLVYARDGKGVYIYTGLSFFRQLPAGVPGAYRLFVNLLSQTLHAQGKD